MNRFLVATLVVGILVACGSAGSTATPGPTASPGATDAATPVAPSAAPTIAVTPRPTPVTTPNPASFPIEAFADISDGPVSEDLATQFQTALDDMASGGGMAATVMMASGTWSGATGMADGVRAVTINDQFAINSITKSVVAAQVMQLVEAGELTLDDPAASHLPQAVVFDTNGATIRHLLGMRSGIPDYDNESLMDTMTSDRQRRWTPLELLQRVPSTRSPVGASFEYSSTNYVLLGLIIEQVRGRPLAVVLREGVLEGDAFARLVFQPDEAPTEPMAMPGGALTATLEERGGYLPSMAEASAGYATFAMASDSTTLARWWRDLCGADLVSQTSLDAMSTWSDWNGYGLGMFDVAEGYARSVGHAGWSPDYVSWAGCMPDYGSVVVVLANSQVDDIGGMARPLVEAVRAIQNGW